MEWEGSGLYAIVLCQGAYLTRVVSRWVPGRQREALVLVLVLMGTFRGLRCATHDHPRSVWRGRSPRVTLEDIAGFGQEV